jgi:hypothetical protein
MITKTYFLLLMCFRRLTIKVRDSRPAVVTPVNPRHQSESPKLATLVLPKRERPFAPAPLFGRQFVIHPHSFGGRGLLAKQGSDAMLQVKASVDVA